MGSDLSLMPIDYNPSLVGYWKLDEGSGTIAYDSSGHGNNGTWGGTEAGTSGYYSKGLNQTWAGYFGGSNDYIQIPYSNLYNFGTGNFSFSFWFDVRGALSGSGNAIFATEALGNSGTNGWYTAAPSSSAAYWTIGGSSGGVRYAFYPPIGTWAFASVVVNNPANTITVYINGKKVGAGGLVSGSSLGSVNPVYGGSNAPLYIGARTTVDNFFDGLIANVQMYNRALSASEIAAIYDVEK